MLYLGIDLHKTQFTVCYRCSGEESYAVYSTTGEGYNKFFTDVYNREESALAGVESTGNTCYFKHRLEEMGIPVKVINTLKFKVINESVKKTDKHDASTIAEFLEKDMLPESRVCSKASEELRRLLKVRSTLVSTIVTVKNQIHGMLVSLGIEDKRSSLQSKKGRQEILTTLQTSSFGAEGLLAQPLFDIIEQLENNVKEIEGKLEEATREDEVVQLLQSIPCCGKIGSWLIRAYTDDISHFSNAKKYSSYAGMVPWVQNSNETLWHGKITKRGPVELRTALIQVVLGMRRVKKVTCNFRIMEAYEKMKITKGSGKAIVATARKLSVIIWHMLTNKVEFNYDLMTDNNLKNIIENMKNNK